jgi:hypothetical protein
LTLREERAEEEPFSSRGTIQAEEEESLSIAVWESEGGACLEDEDEKESRPCRWRPAASRNDGVHSGWHRRSAPMLLR